MSKIEIFRHETYRLQSIYPLPFTAKWISVLLQETLKKAR